MATQISGDTASLMARYGERLAFAAGSSPTGASSPLTIQGAIPGLPTNFGGAIAPAVLAAMAGKAA